MWSFFSNTPAHEDGFTLVELVLDIAILIVLTSMIIFLINPVKQLNKAKDAKRNHDFQQIRNALDTYYNDHNCYPDVIPFGSEWSENGSLYMKLAPQDEECTTKGTCYTYTHTANDNCPQWYVLFGKLANTPDDPLVSCGLPAACLPSNYMTGGYNYCMISGNYDCSYLNAASLPETQISPSGVPIPSYTPVPTVGVPTNTPVPTLSPTATPFPTPSPTPNCNLKYSCSGGPPARCNVVPDGTGTYCGFAGCSGGQCCSNQCL